jgi:peroxiredoxin
MRVHELVREQSRIAAAGVTLVAVFPSKPERVSAYLDRYHARFEILCDPAGAIHRAYGSETSVAGALKTGVNPVKLARVVPHVRNFLAVDGPFHRMPAEFLIDETATIARAYYATEIDDGIPVDEAVAWRQSAAR